MGRSLDDTVNFISKLSPRKCWNAAKVLSSYELSKLTGKPIQWGVPITMAVEPTTTCNLKCPECPSGLRSFTRPTGKLDPALLEQLLTEMGSELIYLYFYFQGEPYLHPQFTDLVRMASERGVYTVTSTNAHYLDERRAKATIESGLDRLIISIDGSTQETYEHYRIGGRLQKVLDGTRTLLETRSAMKAKGPHVIWQFLVVKPNEHQLEEVRRMAAEYGVDELKFKTAQIYDYENGSPLIPENEAYSRYAKQDDGSYAFKGKMDNHCWKLWHGSVMTWDGRINPCCFDKDSTHELGQFGDRSFKDIWENGKYTSFREQLSKSRKSIDICRNCSEGLSVWKD